MRRLDLVEGGVIVDVPAERDDVLGRAATEQEAAFLVVEAEAGRVGSHVVEVHADGVGAEAVPVGEVVGFDDDVAEVDAAEDRGGDGVFIDISLPGSRW